MTEALFFYLLLSASIVLDQAYIIPAETLIGLTTVAKLFGVARADLMAGSLMLYKATNTIMLLSASLAIHLAYEFEFLFHCCGGDVEYAAQIMQALSSNAQTYQEFFFDRNPILLELLHDEEFRKFILEVHEKTIAYQQQQGIVPWMPESYHAVNNNPLLKERFIYNPYRQQQDYYFIEKIMERKRKA